GRDSKTGIAYQVQLEVPQSLMTSIRQVEQVPVRSTPHPSPLSPRGRGEGGEGGKTLRVEDVARVRRGSMPGELDRYNMKRMVSLTANVVGEDLGHVAQRVDAALQAAGEPPRGVTVEVRGQVVPMRQMFGALAGGGVFEG